MYAYMYLCIYTYAYIRIISIKKFTSLCAISDTGINVVNVHRIHL